MFVCVMLFILLVFHSATSLALQVTNQIHADVKKKWGSLYKRETTSNYS